MFHLRLFLYGLAGWVLATLALRLEGQHLLQPGNRAGTLALFAASFPLMAWLMRRLCERLPWSPPERLAGAVSILLPTLLLDPFSSAFFPAVFPNMAPQLAGVFGGWMLWCCAGGLAGVLLVRRSEA